MTPPADLAPLRALIEVLRTWDDTRQMWFCDVCLVDGDAHKDKCPVPAAREALERLAHRCIACARAEGALADAETVATDDVEQGIRSLTQERDGLRGRVALLEVALNNVGGALFYSPPRRCIRCTSGAPCDGSPKCEQREANHGVALVLVRAALEGRRVVVERDDADTAEWQRVHGAAEQAARDVAYWRKRAENAEARLAQLEGRDG